MAAERDPYEPLKSHGWNHLTVHKMLQQFLSPHYKVESALLEMEQSRAMGPARANLKFPPDTVIKITNKTASNKESLVIRDKPDADGKLNFGLSYKRDEDKLKDLVIILDKALLEREKQGIEYLENPIPQAYGRRR